MDLLYFLTLLILPFGGALILAAYLGKQSRSRLMRWPGWLKVCSAGFLAAISPVVYFVSWQLIDEALRAARGETEPYMGPITMLVYGFPVLLMTMIACFFIAGYASVGRK